MGTTQTTAAATGSSIAIAIAETIGKDIVCAEKPAAEAFLKKIHDTISAEGFSIKKEVELFSINQALGLFKDLTVVCGCPDTASADIAK